MILTKIFNTQKYVKNTEIQGEIPSYGFVAKRVMKIVWPAMVEGFLVAMVTMFDGIMVSDLGNNANASVTICKQPIFFMICFITALNIAVTAIVSRRKGEGNSEQINKTMHAGILVSFAIAMVLTVFMVLLARPICELMGAKANTIDLATSYLRIIAAGFIFNALRLTINACQRGIGKTQISMITNVVANLVNIGGNYLLITGKLGFPKLGIEGAAVSTVIGNAVAFLICWYTITFGKTELHFSGKVFLSVGKETYKRIFSILPSTLIEQIFLRIGFITFALIVNYLGTEETYVHGICNDINSLLFTLADGFSIGTAAIVGHRLGEKRKDLAVVYAKVSISLSVVCAILVCAFMISARFLLVGLYKPETVELRNIATNLLLIAALSTIPQNIQWVLSGILRGSGDTKYTARWSFISVTVIRPVVSYVLCYLTPLGLYGAWLGIVTDQGIRCIANIRRFHSRKWINIKV